MKDIPTLISSISEGFKKLNVDQVYKKAALDNIEKSLSKDEYSDFVSEIKALIEKEDWDELLDSFYQVIPFGTGGRRGLMGAGPNRINKWTIMSSAQGHSQYLVAHFGEDARKRGVVIAYDVRNNCKDFAEAAAVVYAANGITVHLFDGIASTPELSYMVRHLSAVAGDVISASHNPPAFNGKKVVDETGGQLISPFDQELVNYVVDHVQDIRKGSFKDLLKSKKICYVDTEDRASYLSTVEKISINPKYRSAKIFFSPFHGTSSTSVYPAMKNLGFDITMDSISGKPDPEFSSITFNIPNPEVTQAYQNLIPPADKISADIILVTDPDGDRVGAMSKETTGWRFYTGNELFVLSLKYLLDELVQSKQLPKHGVVIKTLVTTNLVTSISKKYGVGVIEDLLVGIKYIAYEMNKLEKEGRINDFVLGGEESHGMVVGNYIRDKDSCVPAILISELVSKLKDQGQTLGSYLDQIFEEFGYYSNYLTEIRLPGAEGMVQMAKIMETLRGAPLSRIGEYKVEDIADYWSGEPFKSETDKVSRNVLVFKLAPKDSSIKSITVTVRPSGTEPKTKVYIEVGGFPGIKNIEKEKTVIDDVVKELEKTIIKHCYKILGIDFPDRGFLLFWQLPVTAKMKYFEVEPEIESLKEVASSEERKSKLYELLSFLGANPIQKMDDAFKDKNGVGVLEYLGLSE
ncbi:MAG: phospho-sugar mutase [Patescibacteria group bacterium]|jgi:phosphoglucomutase/phosphomannomutase